MKPHFSLMKISPYGDLIVTAGSEDSAFDFVYVALLQLSGLMKIR